MRVLTVSRRIKAIVASGCVFAASANSRFNPDTFVPSDCTLPPFQSVDEPDTYFSPSEGICGAASSVSLEDMDALALEYAPVVFFHPLEPYTLSNVEESINREGEVLLKDDFVSVVDETLNLSTMFETSRDPITGMNGHKYFFRHDEPNDMGAGYDEEGRSLASIYYNVFDSGNGTVTFNYFFYFEHNGEANFAVLSSVNNTVNFIPFHLKPYGVHEGDWEAVSVIVCKSTTVQEPLAVSYRQHGWSQITDCTAGECNFFKETNHPVGFSALHSHATYPVSTYNLVYTVVDIPFYVNLQGFYVVDRTLYKDEDGSYKYFFPTTSNVKKFEDPYAMTPDDPNAWQGFAGRWGNTIPIQSKPGPPSCFNAEQTAFVDCPTQEEDPVFRFVMEVFGVYNATENSMAPWVTGPAGQVGRLFAETSEGPTGPLAKNFYQRWLPPSTNILYLQYPSNTTEAAFCDSIKTIPDTGRLPVALERIDILSQIYGISAFVAVLTVVNIIVLIYVTARYDERTPLLGINEETGVMQKPSWRNSGRIFVPAILYTLAFLLSLIGGGLFLAGIDGVFDTMEEHLPSFTWETYASLLSGLASAVLVIHSILFIAVWLLSRDLWLRIYAKYEEMEGTTSGDYSQRYWVRWMFMIMFGLLFLSLMLAVVCVIVGIGVVTSTFGFQTFCQGTVGSLDDSCLDLTALGLDKIACGADFAEFCNAFTGSDEAKAFWGAVLVVMAEFYLIACAAAAAYQERSEGAALEMYTVKETPLEEAPQKIDLVPEEK